MTPLADDEMRRQPDPTGWWVFAGIVAFEVTVVLLLVVTR